MTAALLTLQRALVDLALDPRAGGFLEDPAGFARARGLPSGDQAAFLAQRDRFLHYRNTLRAGLWEPMERMLPLTRALLQGSGAWEDCRSAFLAAREVRSPYYRDIAPTFLGWLETSGWGREPWPFLVQLVHFELVNQLVERLDAPEPPDLHEVPGPRDRAVLAASTRILAYAWRVIEATEARPAPDPGPCHLLAFRGPDGATRWRELTPSTSAFLARAQDRPIAQALGERWADAGDLPGALALLADLRQAGAVLGFRA